MDGTLLTGLMRAWRRRYQEGFLDEATGERAEPQNVLVYNIRVMRHHGCWLAGRVEQLHPRLPLFGCRMCGRTHLCRGRSMPAEGDDGDHCVVCENSEQGSYVCVFSGRELEDTQFFATTESYHDWEEMRDRTWTRMDDEGGGDGDDDESYRRFDVEGTERWAVRMEMSSFEHASSTERLKRSSYAALKMAKDRVRGATDARQWESWRAAAKATSDRELAAYQRRYGQQPVFAAFEVVPTEGAAATAKEVTQEADDVDDTGETASNKLALGEFWEDADEEEAAQQETGTAWRRPRRHRQQPQDPERPTKRPRLAVVHQPTATPQPASGTGSGGSGTNNSIAVVVESVPSRRDYEYWRRHYFVGDQALTQLFGANLEAVTAAFAIVYEAPLAPAQAAEMGRTSVPWPLRLERRLNHPDVVRRTMDATLEQRLRCVPVGWMRKLEELLKGLLPACEVDEHVDIMARWVRLRWKPRGPHSDAAAFEKRYRPAEVLAAYVLFLRAAAVTLTDGQGMLRFLFPYNASLALLAASPEFQALIFPSVPLEDGEGEAVMDFVPSKDTPPLLLRQQERQLASRMRKAAQKRKRVETTFGITGSQLPVGHLFRTVRVDKPAPVVTPMTAAVARRRLHKTVPRGPYECSLAKVDTMRQELLATFSRESLSAPYFVQWFHDERFRCWPPPPDARLREEHDQETATTTTTTALSEDVGSRGARGAAEPRL